MDIPSSYYRPPFAGTRAVLGEADMISRSGGYATPRGPLLVDLASPRTSSRILAQLLAQLATLGARIARRRQTSSGFVRPRFRLVVAEKFRRNRRASRRPSGRSGYFFFRGERRLFEWLSRQGVDAAVGDRWHVDAQSDSGGASQTVDGWGPTAAAALKEVARAWDAR